MDLRVTSSILPVVPMLVGGGMYVLIISKQLIGGYNSWQNSLIIICYVFGLLGVIGLFLASFDRAYSDPIQARRVIKLLSFGLISAVLAIVLMFTLGMKNWLVPTLIIFCISSPFMTAVYLIFKLRKLVSA
ncbi:hypothetical protein ACJJID_08430 [Microbulbifer sp. CnH-101-G]|uniref:hypothetical protein n=1 Tax=Microbulbifer sp. CnH-101-G TaxID=3243393 RepID=UPI004039E750